MSHGSEEEKDRAVGALLGLAVGDAIGTTLEFSARDSYAPLSDMIGGGPFELAPGQWTDDTSMALCLADSLLAHGEINEKDLMARFVNWWRYGMNSCTGTCFDIGSTVCRALASFERYGNPIAGSSDPNAAGNGSLMRLAPVPILWCGDRCGAKTAARAQSRTTHGAAAAVDACAYYAGLMVEAIEGKPKIDLLCARDLDGDQDVALVAAGSWKDKGREEIRSSGYVIHTLEAALWAIEQTTNYRDAVLLAANLGDDADTVAAVTGQLAGAIWGAEGIPEDWKARLAWREDIETRAADLYGHGKNHLLLVRTDPTRLRYARSIHCKHKIYSGGFVQLEL